MLKTVQSLQIKKSVIASVWIQKNTNKGSQYLNLSFNNRPQERERSISFITIAKMFVNAKTDCNLV